MWVALVLSSILGPAAGCLHFSSAPEQSQMGLLKISPSAAAEALADAFPLQCMEGISTRGYLKHGGKFGVRAKCETVGSVWTHRGSTVTVGESLRASLAASCHRPYGSAYMHPLCNDF